MLFILVLLLKILFTEARVFCQDINAMSWQPLGFSCPITCNTINAAIEQLQQADYESILQHNNQYYLNMSESEIFHMRHSLKSQSIIHNRRVNSLTADERKHIKLYQTYHRLLSNENFEQALKKEAGKMTAELNKTCSNMASKDSLKKTVNIKCTRRLSKRSEVLEKFTNFLNVYADPRYPFDEEMAGMILEKLEVNLSLHYGVVDYKRILVYLRQALKYHKMQLNTNEAKIIRLQSKNCLSIYKPGCFCRIGYVENDGECVIPEDCINYKTDTGYLERIILH